MPKAKPPKKIAKSPELAALERSVKALLKKIAAYSVEGGDTTESRANQATEMGFFKSRDRLEDGLRRAGLSQDEEAIELVARVKRAASAAPALAAEKRRAVRDKQIAELDDRARDHRRWRIENGLEDPPKY